MVKLNLIGQSMTDLRQLLLSHPTYHADQLYSFIYKQNGKAVKDAGGLPMVLRSWLEESYTLDYGSIAERSVSKDQSTKRFIIKSPTGSKTECVLIKPANDSRCTLCVSCQAGCSLSCTFCHTGSQKFERNLSAGDIIGQYLIHQDPITNVVFMGQGEPLYNWRQVEKAVKILTDPKAIGLGKQKITISTSGIAPLIPKIASELGVNLAISLHAPNDELRSQIMPINQTYPLYTLMDACHQFIKLSPSATRRITFEYVMLKGVNDAISHAEQMSALLKGFDYDDVHFNLLPFNRWPGAIYEPSSLQSIETFKATLQSLGLKATVRTPKGRDIMAACGQLKAVSSRKAVLTS